MTWRKTDDDKFRFNGRRDKKVAVRALTSNDLFDAVLFSNAPHPIYRATFDIENCNNNYGFVINQIK
ncbi:MAG TPA: hypothetical protein VNI84_11475 [Pyrinomonadaceae bacterium]|nr:hypothetical protein [Pyrinomonadaceae bacterium]